MYVLYDIPLLYIVQAFPLKQFSDNYFPLIILISKYYNVNI